MMKKNSISFFMTSTGLTMSEVNNFFDKYGDNTDK